MVVDAPNVEKDDADGKGESIRLTSENTDKVLEMINNINR